MDDEVQVLHESDHTIKVKLWPEVTWSDIAPILDEIQQDRWVTIEVEKSTWPKGGDGDLFPGIVEFVVKAGIAGAIGKASGEFLYPPLREKLKTLYRTVEGAIAHYRRGVPMCTIQITVERDGHSIIYRIPEGLSDDKFVEALKGIDSHLNEHNPLDSDSILYWNSLQGDWQVKPHKFMGS